MQLTQKRVVRKKRIDDKTLVKNQKNILTLANVYAYIYMYIIQRLIMVIFGFQICNDENIMNTLSSTEYSMQFLHEMSTI